MRSRRGRWSTRKRRQTRGTRNGTRPSSPTCCATRTQTQMKQRKKLKLSSNNNFDYFCFVSLLAFVRPPYHTFLPQSIIKYIISLFPSSTCSNYESSYSQPILENSQSSSQLILSLIQRSRTISIIRATHL